MVPEGFLYKLLTEVHLWLPVSKQQLRLLFRLPLLLLQFLHFANMESNYSGSEAKACKQVCTTHAEYTVHGFQMLF